MVDPKEVSMWVRRAYFVLLNAYGALLVFYNISKIIQKNLSTSKDWKTYFLKL